MALSFFLNIIRIIAFLAIMADSFINIWDFIDYWIKSLEISTTNWFE